MDSKFQTNSISPQKIYLIFLFAVILWCSLIFTAPFFAKFEHRFSSGLIYLFFSKICHQMPERSFFIFGKQLPVCSRCTGLYFGFLWGAILYPFIFKLNRLWIPSRKYLLLASIPVAIDIFIRTFRIAENTFASRFTTGLILGAITVLFVVPGILSIKYNYSVASIRNAESKRGRSTGPDSNLDCDCIVKTQ